MPGSLSYDHTADFGVLATGSAPGTAILFPGGDGVPAGKGLRRQGFRGHSLAGAGLRQGGSQDAHGGEWQPVVLRRGPARANARAPYQAKSCKLMISEFGYSVDAL